MAHSSSGQDSWFSANKQEFDSPMGYQTGNCNCMEHMEQYTTFSEKKLGKFPQNTVHGRFQPPLHVNHWRYISNAFKIAEQVIILIINPSLKENLVPEAPHRNDIKNNPFTYAERVSIFESFFENKNTPRARYKFCPFDITDPDTWHLTLDREIPNLINTYGDWSREKLRRFLMAGYKVIHSEIPKQVDVSGTQIREILNISDEFKIKREKLVALGYMPEAINGLFVVLDRK